MELLQGRYSLAVGKHLKFSTKVEKIMIEPVAFFLYKKRDLVKKMLNIDVSAEALEYEKFRRVLLDVCQALIVTPEEYQRITEKMEREREMKRI